MHIVAKTFEIYFLAKISSIDALTFHTVIEVFFLIHCIEEMPFLFSIILRSTQHSDEDFTVKSFIQSAAMACGTSLY